MLKRFSYDLEMKTHEQNRNNKRTEIERFDWFIKRIQTPVAFGWLKLHARELSRNQSILRFDVILQQDWPIEQRLLHIRVFSGGKTKRPCFDLFIHWLIKIRQSFLLSPLGSEGDKGSSPFTPLPVCQLSSLPRKKNAWSQVKQKWIMGKHCLQTLQRNQRRSA